MAKYMTTKTLVLILLYLFSLTSEEIAGESEDLGVLADLGPSDHSLSGRKDSVQADISPAQLLPPSPQPGVRPSDTGVPHPTVGHKEAAQALNSDREQSQGKLTGLTETSETVESNLLDTESLSRASDAGFKTPSSSAGQTNSVNKDGNVDAVNSHSDLIAAVATKLNEQNDEPSEPDRPDSVEVTLSDTSFRNKEKPQNVSSDVNGNVFQDSEKEPDQLYKSVDGYKEDRSYGNPPVQWDSDELDAIKNISAWSPEERERLRAALSEKLGLSAVDPGLAMLPVGQHVHTPASERKSTPSSTVSPDTTTTTESSTIYINNVVESNAARKSQEKSDDDINSDSTTAMNMIAVGNNGESYGRKVLNEGNGDNFDSKQLDEFDEYFYDYDDDEDDYVGGEVLTSVTPRPAEKLGMTEDDIAKSGEVRESEQGNGDTTEFNLEKVFSYEEEDDDDWYYDPEEASVNLKETISKKQTTSSPARQHYSPLPNKAEDAKGNPSETQTEKVAPVLKEGVISKGDLPPRKTPAGPKGTIILYTAVIVILIACFVVFSIWKSPFQNGRPVHQPMTVRTGEEGKRLLDHPFV